MAEILIVKPSSLGDIIHGLLVANAIKQQLGGTRISWVARDLFVPLVKTCPVVDDVYTFHRKGGLRAFMRLISEIRQHQFDYVLDMQGLARTGIMTFLSRSGQRIGRLDAREFSGLAYNLRVGPEAIEGHHAVELLMEFLPPLNLARRIDPLLPFKPCKTKKCAGLRKVMQQPSPIVLFPESRRSEKEWPYFAKLAELLLKQTQHPVVWCGSGRINPPEELTESERFTDLGDKTHLSELPSLLQIAGCCVANDSGPMHLAAAVGCPLVALFGPTPPERFGPWPVEGSGHIILRAEGGVLRSLDAKEVLNSVDQLLQDATNSLESPQEK